MNSDLNPAESAPLFCSFSLGWLLGPSRLLNASLEFGEPFAQLLKLCTVCVGSCGYLLFALPLQKVLHHADGRKRGSLHFSQSSMQFALDSLIGIERRL